MSGEIGRVLYGRQVVEFSVVRRARATLEIAVEPDTSVVVAAPLAAPPNVIPTSPVDVPITSSIGSKLTPVARRLPDPSTLVLLPDAPPPPPPPPTSPRTADANSAASTVPSVVSGELSTKCDPSKS